MIDIHKFWMSGRVSKDNQQVIKSIIENNFKIPRTLDLYKEFIGKTEIERYKLEDFTLTEILKGTSISELTDRSLEIAAKIGTVNVEMGGTACKVPLAKDYIQKVIDKGRIGKKRKTARC